MPRNIFGKERINSAGIDLSNFSELIPLNKSIEKALHKNWKASPFLREIKKNGQLVFDPTDNRRQFWV